jgi:acetyl-CoA acetyltransferase
MHRFTIIGETVIYSAEEATPVTPAYICDAIRTPIGRFAGSLSSVRTDDLAAVPIRSLLERNSTVDWEALGNRWRRRKHEPRAAMDCACGRASSVRPLQVLLHAEHVNPNGGAIAIGHPFGASGAQRATTALYELERRRDRYALCTMCIGVGQGVAVLIERV